MARQVFSPKVYNDLLKIKGKCPPNTYRTILGQLRGGNIVGAAVGIKRVQRRIAKAKEEGGETQTHEEEQRVQV